MIKPPPYPSFPNLRGEQVSLREIRPGDLDALFEISYYDAVQVNLAVYCYRDPAGKAV